MESELKKLKKTLNFYELQKNEENFVTK